MGKGIFVSNKVQEAVRCSIDISSYSHINNVYLQTQVSTAQDIWLLLSMIFVALATFEYAVLLAIKFGKQSEGSKKDVGGKKRNEKCCKIDRYALRVFTAAYSVSVFTYFYAVLTKH